MYSDRIGRLKEAVIRGKPQLDVERLRILKESSRETEAQPQVIKRAKLFAKFLEEKTIFIDENPIVGTQTRYPVGLIPFPEVVCKWMREEGDFYTSLGKTSPRAEDKKLLLEAVDYWEDKCIAFRTDEVWSQKYGAADGISYDDICNAGVCNRGSIIPLGRINVDYGKVLNQGLNAIIEEAEEELGRLPLGSLEALQKRDFLRAVSISCQALSKLAQRYATLARDMSRKETNPERKRELSRIAETCRRVPAKPARTFYEAIQSFWFIHLGLHLEQTAHGYSPGRFALYVYPFYQKDRDEGRITEEEAIELLQLLFIKLTSIVYHVPRVRFESGMGNMFQNLCLGGLNQDGGDATNELDFLIIEAQKRVQVFQPTLSLLYHDKLPPELLLKAAELVRTGIGMPAFFNNDVSIQRLLNYGATLEEARNHCIIGCVEQGMSHVLSFVRSTTVNAAKFLEFALNNGKDPLTGKQIGPQTGDPDTFQSYEKLQEAVRKQLQYLLPLHYEYEETVQALHARFMPRPFASALVDDCIKNGKDITEGGARYAQNGSNVLAVVSLADSLAAIKKLVFDEKSITMRELLAALKANFEGYEELRQLLLRAPKYGNDDDHVDKIAQEWYKIYWEEDQKNRDYRGNPVRTVAYSTSKHFMLGSRTGALPNGRKARLPLADGSVSASPGMDKAGPTALIRSAAKVIDTTKYASSLLNMKFHPSALRDNTGLNRLLALIKSYMDLGGHHVQFNVVSADTLRDAQIHPENYRNLIVRVAGFSALFINLDRSVQDQIIERTELKL